jgi:hypothetical protein
MLNRMAFLALLLILWPQPGYSLDRCQAIFSAPRLMKFIDRIDSAPEPFLGLLDSKIIERMWYEPLVVEITRQLNRKGEALLYTPDVTIFTEQIDGELIVKVPFVMSPNVQKTGEPAKGVDFTFARVMVAILKHVQYKTTVSKNPGADQISSVRLVGGTVVNRSLAEMMQNYGFERGSKPELKGPKLHLLRMRLKDLGYDWDLVIKLKVPATQSRSGA